MFLFKEIMQLGLENNEIAFALTTLLIPLTRFDYYFPFIPPYIISKTNLF